MSIQEAIKILKEIHPMFSQSATHYGGASCFFGVSYLRNYGKLMDKAIALLESELEPNQLTKDMRKQVEISKQPGRELARRYLYQYILDCCRVIDRLTASLKLSEQENEHLELKAKAFEEANKLYSEAEKKYEARIKELEGQQKTEIENG